jgi:hypothetical protein
LRADIRDDMLSDGTCKHERNGKSAKDRCTHSDIRGFFSDPNRAVGRHVLQNRFGKRSAENRNRAQITFEQTRKCMLERFVTARLAHDVRKMLGAQIVRFDVPDAAVLFEQAHELRAVIGTHAISRVNDERSDTVRGHCANVPFERLR